MGHSRPLFIYFRLFNTVDNKQVNKQMFNINFADNWSRTVEFILNIVYCQLYSKDENKEKEAENGPFLTHRTKSCYSLKYWTLADVSVKRLHHSQNPISEFNCADSDSGKRRRRRRCKIFSLKNISLINSREKISLCATSFTFHWISRAVWPD